MTRVLPLDDRLGDPVHRFMGCPLRAIAKRPRLEVGLEDGLQDELQRPLDHAVADRRDRQDADFVPPSFGISFFRFRSGRYVRWTSSSRICSRKRLHALLLDGLERDPVDTRSPVVLLGQRIGFASVSILQTWTYRPQKRQDGSAFALT